jgi:hypothetical protein
MAHERRMRNSCASGDNGDGVLPVPVLVFMDSEGNGQVGGWASAMRQKAEGDCAEGRFGPSHGRDDVAPPGDGGE